MSRLGEVGIAIQHLAGVGTHRESGAVVDLAREIAIGLIRQDHPGGVEAVTQTVGKVVLAGGVGLLLRRDKRVDIGLNLGRLMILDEGRR